MGGMDEYFWEQYKESAQVRFINGMIIVPVAYCKHKNPMCFRPAINRYTPSGRAEIHKMLSNELYLDVLYQLCSVRFDGESIEFCDNLISRFVASRGRCELSGRQLSVDEVSCIRLDENLTDGIDGYKNLRIVHRDVIELRNTEDLNTIKRIINELDCKKSSQIQKLNKWRKRTGRTPVNILVLNNL